jgi:hypothetical protein
MPIGGGGSGGTPGGVTTQVQYNNAGAFGGMGGTSWDNINQSLSISGATVTTNHPVFDLSQIWNAGGVTFTGLKLNIINTASASGSLLADLQVGGHTMFSVSEIGDITFSPTAGGSYVQTLSVPCASLMLNAGGINSVVLSNLGVKLNNSAYFSWTSGASAITGSVDTGLYRNAAGIIEVNNGTSGTYRDLKLRNLFASGGNGSYIQTPSMTVANLAAAATAGAGARAFVTDASTSIILGLGTAVVGGGANKVPVYSDGTNWLIG